MSERGLVEHLRSLREDLTAVRAEYGPGGHAQRAFERLFAAAAAAGRPLDQLRRYATDEGERFFANTIPGTDGHVYWDGAKYGFACNDGKARVPRRWWWTHVKGIEPGAYEDVAPVCGERNCINPEHCEQGRGLFRRRFSDEQMLGALQVAVMRHGRPLQKNEWDALGLRPTAHVYTTRFGSWPKAWRAAGYDYRRVTPNTSTNTGDCLAALRFLHGVLGHWPSNSEFRQNRALLAEARHIKSHSTIVKYLGGWPEALRKAAEAG